MPSVTVLFVPTCGAFTVPEPLMVKVSVRANPLNVEIFVAATVVFPS